MNVKAEELLSLLREADKDLRSGAVRQSTLNAIARVLHMDEPAVAVDAPQFRIGDRVKLKSWAGRASTITGIAYRLSGRGFSDEADIELAQ